MDTNRIKRPVSVSVIGWLFIIISVYMIVSGIFCIISDISMKQGDETFTPIIRNTRHFPFPFKYFDLIFKHFWLVGLFYIGFGSFYIIAGSQFMKLKRWAKIALETILWIYLCYGCGFSLLFLIYFFIKAISTYEPGSMSNPPIIFMIIFLIVGLVSMAISIAPVILILKILRGKPMRDLFNKIKIKVYS